MTNIRFAAELASPTPSDLHAMYGLSGDAQWGVLDARDAVSDAIRNPQDDTLIAVLGPCALTNDPEAVAAEGARIKELTVVRRGIVAVHRMAPWKSRSEPETSWNGLETTDPEAAFRILADAASADANVALEIGHPDHTDRYGSLITLGWLGSRNIGDTELADLVAVHDPTMPVGVKNGIDGSVYTALAQARRIEALRAANGGAPAIVIFRGGEGLQDPGNWEEAYRVAHDLTAGRLIVDVAHGSEMAHHPDGVFKKSVDGQIAAMEHVIRLAEDQGIAPLGIMIEASDVESPVDPVMPLQIALDGVARLHAARTAAMTAA